MKHQTIRIAVPAPMREYVRDRVLAGGYRTTGEYLLDLVRRDQEAEDRRRLRNLIGAGSDLVEAKLQMTTGVNRMSDRAEGELD